jgi:hypothetical protein
MIEYDVSQDGLQIEAFPEGVLDIHETIHYFDELRNDKRIKHGAIEIVYFNNVTDFNISYLESRKITQWYQKTKDIQVIAMTVFVCKTDLAYGMGRMLKSLHQITNPEHKVLVVRSENEIENYKKGSFSGETSD